jgi:RNA polymerase sigma-70 factor (ECF subfamily)
MEKMEQPDGLQHAGIPPPATDWVEEEIALVQRRLLASVRRSCPPWLAHLAEDIVQEALLRLLELRRKSGGDRDWNSSYLSRTAYSAVIDEMRRQIRRRENPEGGVALEKTAGTGNDPDRQAAALEIDRAMRDCLGHLNPPRRAAIACHLQGYTVPEAARFLGWTRKRTEHLVARGLKDLRACLLAKGITP